MPASPASSSDRRCCPVPSTSPVPWRPPHERSPTPGRRLDHRRRWPSRCSSPRVGPAQAAAARQPRPRPRRPSARPSPAGSPSAAAGDLDRLPDDAARRAPRGRDAGGHDLDHRGRHRARDRRRPVADRGRQLRRARRLRLVRRRRVPSRRARVRDPGRRRPVRPEPERRSRAGRHRRAAVHDQGRAGDRDVRARDGRDGADPAAGLRRARSSSSSSTTRRSRRSRPRNTYQIIGKVTSGMEVVDAIAAAADKEIPDQAGRR